MEVIGILLELGAILIILMLIGFMFWMWMFIDALKKRDMMWVALFVVSLMTGALSGLVAGLYYLIVYKKNKPVGHPFREERNDDIDQQTEPGHQQDRFQF